MSGVANNLFANQLTSDLQGNPDPNTYLLKLPGPRKGPKGHMDVAKRQACYEGPKALVRWGAFELISTLMQLSTETRIP